MEEIKLWRRDAIIDKEASELAEAMATIHTEYITAVEKAKEQVLKTVLKDLLGREPEEADAKRCQLVTTPSTRDAEILCYDHNPLGVVYPRYNAPPTVENLGSHCIIGFGFEPTPGEKDSQNIFYDGARYDGSGAFVY
jgi:hypothetical protein